MDGEVRDFKQVYIIYVTIPVPLTRGTGGDCNIDTEVIQSAMYASKRIRPRIKYK
jgi:hypothetical protein